MSPTEHQRRHRTLYEALVELMADFEAATGKDPMIVSVDEIAEWAKVQSEEPDHKAI